MSTILDRNIEKIKKKNSNIKDLYLPNRAGPSPIFILLDKSIENFQQST